MSKVRKYLSFILAGSILLAAAGCGRDTTSLTAPCGVSGHNVVTVIAIDAAGNRSTAGETTIESP